jgi:hypothetical protein
MDIGGMDVGSRQREAKQEKKSTRESDTGDGGCIGKVGDLKKWPIWRRQIGDATLSLSLIKKFKSWGSLSIYSIY